MMVVDVVVSGTMEWSDGGWIAFVNVLVVDDDWSSAADVVPLVSSMTQQSRRMTPLNDGGLLQEAIEA